MELVVVVWCHTCCAAVAWWMRRWRGATEWSRRRDDAKMSTSPVASSTATETENIGRTTGSRRQTARSALAHTASCRWNLSADNATMHRVRSNHCHLRYSSHILHNPVKLIPTSFLDSYCIPDQSWSKRLSHGKRFTNCEPFGFTGAQFLQAKYSCNHPTDIVNAMNDKSITNYLNSFYSLQWLKFKNIRGRQFWDLLTTAN